MCGKVQGNTSILKFNVHVPSSQHLECGEPLGSIWRSVPHKSKFVIDKKMVLFGAGSFL